MRKKRKKIIRVRRNPVEKYPGYDHELKSQVYSALLYGLISELVLLITMFRNEEKYCEDCSIPYNEVPIYKCKCDSCKDCKQKRCVCLLADLEITDKTPEGRIEIRKIIWEFAKYNTFSKISIPNNISIMSAFENKEITKSEVRFLKSLTQNSKFPKYTSLMKRLFEID
ncbi:MAG: hypothetical protein KDC47_10735 [Flavobacteriaceae bacterium]|nr:hypothetical protein [Flavobacteriaceae bacterium]